MLKSYRRIILIALALGMLVLGILVPVCDIPAAENGLKTVSVAYFYDENYFGTVYDAEDKAGFGYNYLQAVGNFAGWEYKYVYGDYNTLLEQFMLGKIDIMPAVPGNFDSKKYYQELFDSAKNEESRNEMVQNSINVLFPNQPMNSVDYFLCVPYSDNKDAFSISSLVSTEIAAPSIISEYVDSWMSTLGLNCKIVEYDNLAACINAVNNGEASALIGESSAAESGMLVYRKVGSIDYYLGISSNDRSLLVDVNNALDSLNASTDGLVNTLKNSYNTGGELERTISKVERDWINEHPKVQVGTLSDMKPYSHIDPVTGEMSGFIYETVENIFFNAGAEVDVEYTHFSMYKDMLSALEDGSIDVAFPVPQYLYQSEINGYMYTKEIADVNMSIIYKGEFSEGVFASIAYLENGIAKYYVENNYKNSSMFSYDSIEECIDAVLNENVSCTIIRSDQVNLYLTGNRKYNKLNCLTLPDTMSLCLGVKRGNTDLYRLVNRGVCLTARGYELNDQYLNAASKAVESEKRGFWAQLLSSTTFIFVIAIFVLVVIVALLLIFLSRVIKASRHLKRANEEIKGVADLQQQNFDVIGILARDYSSVFKIDLETEDIQTFRMDTTDDSRLANLLTMGAKCSDVFNQYVRDFVYEDDKPKMYDEMQINAIRKKLRKRGTYAVRFRKLMSNEEPRYYEVRVSSVDIDVTGKIMSVVIAFIDCNDEILHEMKYMKDLEKAIKSEAVISGLTGDFDWVAYVANIESKDSAPVTHYRIGDMFMQRFPDWDKENNYNHMIDLMAENLVIPEDRKNFISETNKGHIRKYLMRDVAYFINFRVSTDDGIEFYQIKCVADIKDGRLFGFILGFHSVDEEIRKEREQQEKLEQMVEERTAQLEDKNASLNRMNNDIIELMGNVVEGRDEESGQHVRRVKDFTNILATQVMNDYPEYGLTPEIVDIITSASALHDVGKITIPDNILLKPGRLTNEEYEIMKTHTVNGCAILDKMPDDWDKTYMKISMEICRYHHEKYDGKGYPEGLQGDEIPISAQIVSVADCYDALVSKRVYKDAYTCDEAYNMIKNGECGAFSPHMLDCFAQCKDKFEKQVEAAGNE